MPAIPELLSGDEFNLVMDSFGDPIVLGEGRYGRVYLGQLNSDEQLLAIKLLFKEHGEPQETIREAGMLQYLSTCDVCPYFHGMSSTSDDRYHNLCLVSDFVGNPATRRPVFLADVVADCKEMSVQDPWNARREKEKVLKVILSLLRVIQMAHDQGVIINDIKMDNIVLDEQDGIWRPYIIDLGIANYGVYDTYYALTGSDDKSIATFRRKYPHVDPETIKSRELTEATDIFAFGWMLQSSAEALDHQGLQDIAQRCMLPISHRPKIFTLIKDVIRCIGDARYSV